MTAITRFRGNYAFLSNFYSSPITVNGIAFPTVEHAFQAAKVRLDHPRRRDAQILIAEHPTPAGAKRAGRSVTLRADWKTAHLPIMRRLLALKFADRRLRRLLMDTSDLPLIEGNDWKDTYWGVCNGVGRNQLGVLLMELRAELQNYDPEEALDRAVERQRDELNHCNEEDPRVRNDRLNAEADAATRQALDLHDHCPI
jgi:ribA/ribD-fused uncharacterized protein